MTALFGLLRKEIYHILRDRRTLAVLILLPIVEVILFGFSIRTDITDVRLAVVDPTPDVMTHALRAHFDASGTFRTVAVPGTVDSVRSLFERNTAQIAIDFGPRFAARARSRDGAQLSVIVDATEPNIGTGRLAYVQSVVSAFVASERLETGAIHVEPRIRSRFNPTRESANLFVPGLMAMVLTIISALMTALSLTREKETGTMETLLVSPLAPWQIIIGKVAPYLAIGFLSVILVLAEARFVFHVPIEGSLILLLFEGLLFILVALAIGILVSASTSSQRVAMMVAMLATMMPTMMLSGFVFPIESMPAPLQWVSNAMPAKWFVIIARGIMLKGVGLAYLWRETLILAAMAAVLLLASARSFQPRLE